MIKIAFVIDTIESPTAGTEKQLLMLIKHLDRSRFEPYLCVLRVSEWLRENFRYCKLVDVNVPSFARPASYVNILKFSGFLKQQKIDIVQTQFVEGNKVGTLVAKLAGVRTIISTRRNQGYWHNKLEIMMLNTLNKWATYILANSENTRQWAVKTEGIDPNRIHVIHNSLETEHYCRGTEDQRQAFRVKLGFPADAVMIGIVANLRPVKALDVFVRAAEIVAKSCPDVCFILVGEGPERQALEALCNDLGLTSQVRFLGKRTDIPEILGCLDIGVLSSSSESFSNSIVEYMAASLPVVCTDVGGAREAVEDGVNGYVVQSGDHSAMANRITAILTTGVMSSLGQNSRNKAENLFSLKAIIGRYELFYEGVTKR